METGYPGLEGALPGGHKPGSADLKLVEELRKLARDVTPYDRKMTGEEFLVKYSAHFYAGLIMKGDPVPIVHDDNVLNARVHTLEGLDYTLARIRIIARDWALKMIRKEVTEKLKDSSFCFWLKKETG